MGKIAVITRAHPALTFSHAAEAFLSAHITPGAWSPGTAVKYRQTLTALAGQLAASAPAAAADIAGLDTPAGARALDEAFAQAFGALAPATRARHLAALRSALVWWREAGWLVGDPTSSWARPKVPVDATRALTRDQIAALWRLDVPLRDKTLWRMLYETAARAEEILGLDAGDLDLPSKRARVLSKGGTTDWVHWQTGAAILLPGCRAGVPRQPQARPRGGHHRPVPGHRPGPAVLPPCRRAVRAIHPAPGPPGGRQRRTRRAARLDPASAPSLDAHP